MKININVEELNKRILALPSEKQDLILHPEKNSTIVQTLKDNQIDHEEDFESVVNGIKLVALNAASKDDLFQLIYFILHDDEVLANKAFIEIDDKILIPNGFTGSDKDTSSTENPTTDDEYEELEYTEEEKAFLNSLISKEETAEDILREIENPTPSIIKPIQPVEVVVKKDTEIPAVNTKEDILDSKLKEPVIQTPKSTYYKVDPYREQAE